MGQLGGGVAPISHEPLRETRAFELRGPGGRAGHSGRASRIGYRSGGAVDLRFHSQDTVDPVGPDRGGVAGIRAGGEGAGGVSVADALQPAGGVARRRFLRSRAVAASGRRAGRSDARSEHPRQHAAGAAIGGHGGYHAAAHGDARDRGGHLRLRRAPAPAPGQRRGRAAAGRAGGAVAGPDGGGAAPGSLPERARAKHISRGVPGRRGTLGRPAYAGSRKRPAPGAAGDRGPDPGVQRAGIASLAAAGSRAGPRAE